MRNSKYYEVEFSNSKFTEIQPFFFTLLALAGLSEGFERKQQNHLLCGWCQKNVIQNNHHSFYNEGVQAIKIRKNGDYNG